MIIHFLIAALSTPPPTLAVDSMLVGQYQSKQWTQASFDVPTWKNVVFRQVLIGKMGKQVKVSNCFRMEFTQAVHVKGPDFESTQGALWSGPTPAFPRPVTVAKSLSKSEQKALRDFLAPRDLKNLKFNIQNVVRGDFDGDGRADSLVECVSVSKDYSLVLYSKGGKKIPSALYWQDKDSAGDLTVARIVGVADLDRNGTLDVILSITYKEDMSGLVYSLAKSEVVKLVTYP